MQINVSIDINENESHEVVSALVAAAGIQAAMYLRTNVLAVDETVPLNVEMCEACVFRSE